jgi:hypothetical protein
LSGKQNKTLESDGIPFHGMNDSQLKMMKGDAVTFVKEAASVFLITDDGMADRR